MLAKNTDNKVRTAVKVVLVICVSRELEIPTEPETSTAKGPAVVMEKPWSLVE
jgi:hypothetical protein